MLCGDGGDDIKGCQHWGPVTAAAALAKCGSLEGCWQNPWAVPCTARQRDSLMVFRRTDADKVRNLVTLRTDVSEVYDALR
jgi:5'-3' exonuclease